MVSVQDSLPGRHDQWQVWLRQGECVVASHAQLLKAERRRFKNSLGVEAGARDGLRIVLPGESAEGLGYMERKKGQNDAGMGPLGLFV